MHTICKKYDEQNRGHVCRRLNDIICLICLCCHGKENIYRKTRKNKEEEMKKKFVTLGIMTVSYTHLDVYKRQILLFELI